MKFTDQPALSWSACQARHNSLCRPLADLGQRLVAQRLAQHLTFAKGTHLYREGEANEQVFILTRGWVLLYHQVRNGERQGLELLLPGAFFGFLPSPGSPTPHSALCLTDVKLCCAQADAMFRQMQGHPDVAISALRMCAHNRMRLHELIVDIARRPAVERVARFLVQLHDHEDFDLGDLAKPWIPLTQQELGDLLGLTVVHTNRVMRQLRDAKAVEAKRGGLRIANLDRLLQLAGLPVQQPSAH